LEAGYMSLFGEDKKENTIKILKGLEEIAQEMGCTQAQLVLAWAIVNQDISSCIFGATKTRQVEENLKALDVAANWTEDIEKRIEDLLGNSPLTPMDFNTFTPMASRRSIRVDYHMKKSDPVKMEEISKLLADVSKPKEE
jgi:hypothetical protein